MRHTHFPDDAPTSGRAFSAAPRSAARNSHRGWPGRTLSHWLLAVVAGSAILTGCTDRPTAVPTAPIGQPASARKINELAQDQLRRMQQMPGRRVPDAVRDTPVRFIDLADPTAATAVAAPRPQPPPAPLQPPPAPDRPDPNPVAEAANPPTPQPASLADVLSQLKAVIRQERQPAIQRALTAAALSLAGPNRTLDEVDLAALDVAQRTLVKRYHQLLVTLTDRLAAGGTLDPQQLAGQIERMFDPMPIRIRQIHLCRRVKSFGDFQAFDQAGFLAGRENLMVLYVEVDRYRAFERSDGAYEVRLKQEIVLYTDPGGTAVWQQTSPAIVDVSRNRRRDFYVTQLLRLPSNLSVGRYLLKVSVTDEHSATIDETQVPLQIVADQTLVRGSQR